MRTPHGSQKFSVLTKVVKCALTLSHGNGDNERSLPANKKTLTKDRTNFSGDTEWPENNRRSYQEYGWLVKYGDNKENVVLNKRCL